MSDTTGTEVEETTDATTDAETAAEEQTQEIDYKAEFEKWKAQARANEARAKANADKAKRFDEIEEASKTELQKAAERAEAAEKRAAEAERRALVTDVAARTKVPAKYLTGDTVEELEQAAADFQNDIAALVPKPAGARAGGADLTGGSGKPVVYTREMIREKSAADPSWYSAHRDEIMAANAAGRIIS
jgi:lysyl-tRNA synthetase class I